jgi:transcriptional regulator with XRE-family HTH domain
MEVLPNKSFSDRISCLVEQFGSQERLGELCGISGVMIGKYASGKSEPTREKLLAIAEGARVNILWLMTGEGPMAVDDPPVVKEPETAYEDQELIKKGDSTLETAKTAIEDIFSGKSETERLDILQLVLDLRAKKVKPPEGGNT